MNIWCHKCKKIIGKLKESKIPDNGIFVTCPFCKNKIFVKNPTQVLKPTAPACNSGPPPLPDSVPPPLPGSDIRKIKASGNSQSHASAQYNKEHTRESLFLSGIILFFICFAFWLGFHGSDRSTGNAHQITTKVEKRDWRKEDNSIMAYIMMEDFVKRRLKAPATADFPGVWEREGHVRYLGNQRYRIISWVDAQNSFGAKIRTYFVGEVRQASKDEWQLVSLRFVE